MPILVLIKTQQSAADERFRQMPAGFSTELMAVKTNDYQNSFDYAGAKVWNALPDDLKGEKSIGAFKNKLESVDLFIDF